MMSNQDPTTKPRVDAEVWPRRRDFAIAALLTLVVAAAVYVALGYFLGVVGFFIAVAAWLAALGFAASRRTPRGWGATLGLLLLVLISVVAVVVESFGAA